MKPVFFGCISQNAMIDKKLFEQYFSGDCVPETHRKTERWIEDNMFTDEFDILSQSLLEKMEYSDPQECERMLGLVHRRINDNEPGCFRPKRRRLSVWIAAASVALIASVAMWTVFSPRNAVQVLPTDFVECYASCGSSEKIMLPDSTEVTLYADSRTIYDRNNFNSFREVWLFGDAYFDVTHRNGASFEVRCSKSSIKVLGTRFSVLSHDDDDDFEVSLYEGKVRLSSAFNERNDTISLCKGDYVRIDKQLGGISKQNRPGMDLDTFNIVYSDTKISDIAARLERRYGKTLIIDDKEYARLDPRLHLMFGARDSLDNVLDAICTLSGLTKKSVGSNQIILTRK